MKHVPVTLICLRLLAGAVILLLALFNAPSYSAWAVGLFSFGLLSDIFDGIIARKLGVSNERLRRLDSTADQVFWLTVAASVFVRYPSFFYDHALQLLLLIAAEAMAYLVCFLKFRKEVATHAIASKIWTLVLFACMAELMVSGTSGILFQLSFYAGLVTRLEIIAIIFLLREWTNDVPSVYHAVLLRQGREIKRNKLFNG